MMLQKTDNIKKIGQICFALGIILELLVMMTDHFATWELPYRGRITHIAFILFLMKAITNRYNKKQLLLVGLVGLISVISYFTCDDEYLIRCVVFVFASYDINVDYTLKLIFYTTLVGTIVIIGLSFVGIGGPVVDIRDYGRGMEEARYSLGFNHANNLHDIYWYLVSIIIMLRREKTTLLEYVALSALNVVLYLFTASRTGVITIQLVIVGCIVVKLWGKLRLSIIPALCSFVTFVLVIAITIYGSTYNIGERRLVALLDRPLTGRLEMLTEHANIKNWVLFSPPRGSEYIDNGFATLAYSYGVVILFTCIVSILYLMCSLAKKKYVYLLIVMTGAILVMFMESTFVLNVSLLCNMLLLVMIGNANDIELSSNIS